MNKKTVTLEIQIPELEYEHLLEIAKKVDKDPVALVTRSARFWIRGRYRIMTLPPNYSDIEF